MLATVPLAVWAGSSRLSSAAVKFEITDDAGIDNVVVGVITEPSASLLAVLGLMTSIIRYRRR